MMRTRVAKIREKLFVATTAEAVKVWKEQR